MEVKYKCLDPGSAVRTAGLMLVIAMVLAVMFPILFLLVSRTVCLSRAWELCLSHADIPLSRFLPGTTSPEDVEPLSGFIKNEAGGHRSQDTSSCPVVQQKRFSSVFHIHLPVFHYGST